MPGKSTEISALATALSDLTARVTALADVAAAEGDPDISSDLFAIERALTSANRKLTKLSVRFS